MAVVDGDDDYYERLDAQQDWSEGDETKSGLLTEDLSVLLWLVQSYEWAAALVRIGLHPEEARAVGVEGRTPLHVACDHDAPPSVVQALLRAYPEASTRVGTSDMNPLHITCSSQHASVHIVQILLEGGDQIQTSMRDVDGDTPLHTACRCGAPIDVLEVLLRANPTVVTQRDYEGLTPLLRLWVRYFVILGDGVIEGVRGPADLKGELEEAWKKTELLMACAHHGSFEAIEESGVIFRALHAAAAVDCPRAIVKIATILHPDQLEDLDEKGLTPLLIAAKAPIFKVRDLSDDGYLLEDRIHGDENFDALSNDEDLVEESQASAVIDILVQTTTTSTACIPSPCGRIPLNWALMTGKKWGEGIRALVQAYPDGLSMADTETGLYPFMLAAVGDKADCSTIFDLLRHDPSLVVVSTSRP
jgi:hypothetical protein